MGVNTNSNFMASTEFSLLTVAPEAVPDLSLGPSRKGGLFKGAQTCKSIIFGPVLKGNGDPLWSFF